MFCTQCGTSMNDDANFCPKCGKATTAKTDKSHTEEITSEMHTEGDYRISIQGFSKELTEINGSYDTVEMANLNQEKIKEIIKKLKGARQMHGQKEGADLCPPVFNIFRGEEMSSFEIAGGKVIDSGSAKEVSEKELFVIISGKEPETEAKGKRANKKPSGALEWGSDHKDVAGLIPVRKKDIAPTNRIKTEAATIQYKNSPYISEKVRKSAQSGKQHVDLILFGVLAVIMMIGGFAAEEPGMGIISFLVAVTLFILAGYVKGKSKGILFMGFDWTTNTVWTIFPGQKLTWLGNANCITRFSIERQEITSTRYGNVGSSSTKIYTTIRDKHSIYLINAEKTDGSRVPVCKLYKDSEAAAVLNKINALLNQQND